VSDVAMHLKNQNIFVHSGQSNQLKVVHDDPGACSSHALLAVLFSRSSFPLNFLFDFAEVSVTFEWERDKTDGNPLAGAGVPSETVKSSQTKCAFIFLCFLKQFRCLALFGRSRLSAAVSSV
jgi:hypothetical protein